MTTKHTPGPWRIGKHYGAVVADHPVPEISGSDHVEAYGGHMVGESIAPRNRALIAAAPELLEALQVVRRSVGWQVMHPETQALIDAAIAKASTEAP